ncbi:MAG: PAQR family membrane homeostasis protein TrhA [Pirellulales bacterium]
MTMLQERVGTKALEEPPRLPPAKVSQVEELANAVTHGIGLVLSIVGAVVLITHSHSQGDAYRVVGCTVFALTLIAVYAASTLSHTPLRPRLKHLFRTLDQGSIYLLIVGTCMPFALTYLRTDWWFLFFGSMWTVALCGFVSKTLFSHRVDAVATWSYLLLGWMPIATVPSLIDVVPAAALWWMLIGGLCYTFGTLFLVHDNRHPLFHPVWHLFVIAGSTCHFMTILFFVDD